jgi:Domain of unknown function (DUF1902)
MTITSIIVKAEWMTKQSYVAQSDDVLGLAAQSPSIEHLRPKVLGMISDLMELNKTDVHLSEIAVYVVNYSFDKLLVVQAS